MGKRVHVVIHNDIRIAYAGLSAARTLILPRTALASINARPEAEHPGVYILVGKDGQAVYVGDQFESIANPIAEADDWITAIFIVSPNSRLTKRNLGWLKERLAQGPDVAISPSDADLAQMEDVWVGEYLRTFFAPPMSNDAPRHDR